VAVQQPNGTCVSVPVADGTSCNDGSACTSSDSCHAGVCGGTPVLCPASTNPCLAAVCQANTGCGFTNVADGTACNGDVCTSGSTCLAGVCAGGSPVTCGSPNQTCDPASGSCVTECGPSGCFVTGTGLANPTLTVPPSALSATVPITMVDLGGDPTNPSVFRVYQLGPDGTTFATPATVDLPAPPLAAGHTAVIEVTQGTGWVAIPTTLNGNRVTGPISHFSQCRTRDEAPTLTLGLVVDDMVQFQDFNELNPVGLWPAGCDPGSSSFGICVTVRNGTAATIFNGQATIFGWQCYNRTLFTYIDPVTNKFEGTHCNPGLLIVCGSTQVNVPLPPGGLAPSATTTVRYSFPGETPLGSCFDGSADVGIDFAFREPHGPNDQDAGRRSAKVGPFVNGALFDGLYPVEKQGLNRKVKNFLIQAQF
jgi:hypothetical protein